MPSFSESRRLVSVYLADDYKKRNRTGPHDYPFSELVKELGVYPGTVGQAEVKKGIISDLSDEGFIAEIFKRNGKSIFRITLIQN